jgi:hypothetical protein
MKDGPWRQQAYLMGGDSLEAALLPIWRRVVDVAERNLSELVNEYVESGGDT